MKRLLNRFDLRFSQTLVCYKRLRPLLPEGTQFAQIILKLNIFCPNFNPIQTRLSTFEYLYQTTLEFQLNDSLRSF